MTRKLASIQRVIAVDPIDGADSIERIQVLGWGLVAKKGEFRVGDLCVYFEIDSVLPPRPEFAFMEARKYQVRTIRLRGTLSQGLAMPMSILGDDWEKVAEFLDPPGEVVGLDVTTTLGVEHRDLYESESLDGAKLGGFPGRIHRTDEQRIQSAPELLDEMRGLPWVATLKMHGTSCTAAWLDGEFILCSRGRRLKADMDHIYSRAVNRYDLPAKLERLGRNLAIQGEVMGPKVQDNPLKLDRHEFHVFTIQDLDTQTFLNHDETAALCAGLGLQMVSVMFQGDSFDLTQEQMLEMARGVYDGTTYPREGLVFRPREERITKSGDRLSFKVINNDFLLKGKD